MSIRLWIIGVILIPATVLAQQRSGLTLEPESVYAPPEPPREDQGVNEGGVNVFITATYLTDYVYRGIDRSESSGAEDSPNLGFDSTLKFDLGRMPHPFIGVFVNIYDSDPKSRFQEVRPYFGFDWNLRPLLFEFGHNNYIFPDRDNFNTAEVFGKVTLDDSYFFRTDQPIFSPYLFGSYDYSKYHGMYLELGISHDFAIEDTPITLTPQAHVAYVYNERMFIRPTDPITDPAFDFGSEGADTGFQHYQVGLVATYALNQLFHLSKRYGQFDLKGYLFYTDGIDDKLRADTELFGGVGIAFSY
jgi:hypothetical protein